MGHNGCDGSQASGPWAIGSGYRFSSWAHFNPHGQDVPFKHTKRSAKRREVFVVFLKVHLMEAVFEINERI